MAQSTFKGVNIIEKKKGRITYKISHTHHVVPTVAVEFPSAYFSQELTSHWYRHRMNCQDPDSVQNPVCYTTLGSSAHYQSFHFTDKKYTTPFLGTCD